MVSPWMGDRQGKSCAVNLLYIAVILLTGRKMNQPTLSRFALPYCGLTFNCFTTVVSGFVTEFVYYLLANCFSRNGLSR
jgi:uncharacterized membrane protein YvlD (DUF360 family)